MEDESFDPDNVPFHRHIEKKDEDEDNQSQTSSQTDLSDVGLCALNIHEY